MKPDVEFVATALPAEDNFETIFLQPTEWRVVLHCQLLAGALTWRWRRDMTDSAGSDSDAKMWNKLISCLDDKLQFGLLERVRRVVEYKFEGDTLIVAPGSSEDAAYLRKDSVHQQLTLFAEQSTKVKRVIVRDGQ